MNLIKLIFLVKSKVSALTREEEREKTIPYLYIENKCILEMQYIKL